MCICRTAGAPFIARFPLIPGGHSPADPGGGGREEALQRSGAPGSPRSRAKVRAPWGRRRPPASSAAVFSQVTEGRPDGTGAHTAKVLAEVGIPCTLVLDSAVAYMMDRVDLVRACAERLCSLRAATC